MTKIVPDKMSLHLLRFLKTKDGGYTPRQVRNILGLGDYTDNSICAVEKELDDLVRLGVVTCGRQAMSTVVTGRPIAYFTLTDKGKSLLDLLGVPALDVSGCTDGDC